MLLHGPISRSPAARRRAGGAAFPLAALAGLLCALALGGAFAGEARADAAQVTIVSPGGSQRTLALEALAGGEDVSARPYVLRSAAGEAEQTVSGFSLGALLEAAGVDTFGFSYLEAQRPAGGAVLLSRHQALDAGAFAEGPPVVYAAAGGTGFLRPSGGPDDLNATDSFVAPQGVTLALRRDKPLRVRAEASTVRTRPGKPVAFSAVVERAGAGESLVFSWYFDDGHSAKGARARHSFARPGSYDVIVGVTTPGDDTGASAVVTVQVGAPGEGPNRKGGGRSRAADAPDHGAAGGGGGAPVPGASGPSAEPPAARERSASPRPEPTRRPKPKPRPRPAASAGSKVSGRLLAAVPSTAPAPARSVAARRGRLSEQGSGPGLPGAALGVIVTAGLLGLGALAEARSLWR